MRGGEVPAEGSGREGMEDIPLTFITVSRVPVPVIKTVILTVVAYFFSILFFKVEEEAGEVDSYEGGMEGHTN